MHCRVFQRLFWHSGPKKNKNKKKNSIKFEDPPYLLIGRTFREKCIFMDYICMKEFLIIDLNSFVVK